MKKVTITIDLGDTEADAALVDALAGLALALHRNDRHLCIKDAPRDFAELAAFMGLADVLGVKMQRQTE